MIAPITMKSLLGPLEKIPKAVFDKLAGPLHVHERCSYLLR